MAYNLVGKDFVPVDVAAKVTGRAKYAEDFRAEGMVFCKTLTSPIPHAKITTSRPRRRSRSRACSAFSPRTTCRNSRRRSPRSWSRTRCSTSASRSSRSRPRPRRSPPRRSRRSRSSSSSCRMQFTDPLESLFPGGPDARSNGNVAAAQINLQTVKWDAGDFAAASDDKLPLGKPAEQWYDYGDIDAGFKASKLDHRGKLRLQRSYSHHQHGDALRHGVLGRRQVLPLRLEPEPHRRRPQHRPPDRHQAGGSRPGRPGVRRRGLRQQDPGLSQHGDRRLDVEEDRPAGHASHLPHGGHTASAARDPASRGASSSGFSEDGKLLAADMYIVQENGPHIGGGDFRSPAMRSRWSIRPTRCGGARFRVLTNTPPVGSLRGPAKTSSCRPSNRSMDKAARELGVDRAGDPAA